MNSPARPVPSSGRLGGKEGSVCPVKWGPWTKPGGAFDRSRAAQKLRLAGYLWFRADNAMLSPN
ncbi:hypothetical protein NIM86_00290 [Notoacmeibacter sp. MSK16QG-6]|nr:hypothetical protein [Notoacmeibacter sp. MSK16QG-6]